MNDYVKISGYEKIEGVEILYLQKTEKYDFSNSKCTKAFISDKRGSR